MNKRQVHDKYIDIVRMCGRKLLQVAADCISSASDSTFDCWRYINIWMTLTLIVAANVLDDRQVPGNGGKTRRSDDCISNCRLRRAPLRTGWCHRLLHQGASTDRHQSQGDLRFHEQFSSQFIIRLSLVGRIMCYTPSVCLSVRQSLSRIYTYI